jgi:hypothetical protein
MNRRSFLEWGAAATGVCAGTLAWRWTLDAADPLVSEDFPLPPVWSVIPVVGDGKWIWTKPPENQTGYLEPRPFQLKLGIELIGTGNSRQVIATTAAPVALPEQKIDDVQVNAVGGQAGLRQVAPEAGQIVLTTPALGKGQKVSCAAIYKLTLHKEYQGYKRDQFPAKQNVPLGEVGRQLGESPGIQMRDKIVRELAEQIAGQIEHPWDKAAAFHAWGWKHIRPRIGSFTSAVAAIKDRVGDCEEYAAVFVALCRNVGIPARLVWAPNHNWAEFWLHDSAGKGHWIPAHTSCYSWFGWTGAHELILQKGDAIHVPEKPQPQRLLPDWMQYQGARPKATFFAELTPLAETAGGDPGPGARSKNDTGEWILNGTHSQDRVIRDGAKVVGGLRGGGLILNTKPAG